MSGEVLSINTREAGDVIKGAHQMIATTITNHSNRAELKPRFTTQGAPQRVCRRTNALKMVSDKSGRDFIRASIDFPGIRSKVIQLNLPWQKQ